MPLYEYRPEQESKSAKLGIASSDPEKIEAARYELIQQAIDSAQAIAFGIEGENKKFSSDELTILVGGLHERVNQLHDADPQDLPLDIAHPLLEEIETSTVIDGETGLALSLSDFRVQTDEIGDTESYHRYVNDDPEIYKQILRTGSTHHAYQIQPVSSPRGFEVTEHHSLGYVPTESYQPIVTVLDETHPVREAVAKNSRALA